MEKSAIDNKVKSIIKNLSSSLHFISSSDISYLCQFSRKIFLKEESLLIIDSSIYICGDIHGQFEDLLEIFRLCKPFQNSKILFLGDYVDRGPNGVEVFSLLLAYKICFPNNIFLIRGNHEDRNISHEFGFYQECIKKHSFSTYIQFTQVFESLPLAAVIGSKLFCVHGGIGPGLENLQQIRDIRRPIQIPTSGFLADMLWSDPDPVVSFWCYSERGEFHDYGRLQIQIFLIKNRLSKLIRAHQYVPAGIEYPFFPEKSVLTVFSASNYLGRQNSGAYLFVDDKLQIKTFFFKVRIQQPILKALDSKKEEKNELVKSSSPLLKFERISKGISSSSSLRSIK